MPGGLVEEDEDLDTYGAYRELEEETGVAGVSLEQLHAFGKPGRDPRGRLVTVADYTLVRPDRLQPKAADDAANVRWFAVDRMPALAFDHATIITMARRRLLRQAGRIGKRVRVPPKTFPLAELRSLAEIVGGEPLDLRRISAPACWLSSWSKTPEKPGSWPAGLCGSIVIASANAMTSRPLAY